MCIAKLGAVIKDEGLPLKGIKGLNLPVQARVRVINVFPAGGGYCTCCSWNQKKLM